MSEAEANTATDVDTVEHLINREPEVLSEEPVVFDDGEVLTRSQIESDAEVVTDDAAKTDDDKEKPSADSVSDDAPVETVETLQAALEHERNAKRAARRAERRLKQEVQELRNPKPAETDKGGNENKEPVFDDFEELGDYMKAWKAWDAKSSAPEANPAAPPVTPELAAAIADMQDVREQGEQKYSDYAAVVYDDNAVLNDVMIMAIADSDAPEDLAYYLAKNKDEATRISTLDDRGALRAITRLEERIKSGSISLTGESKSENNAEPAKKVDPVTRKTTGAPAPIKTIEGGGASQKNLEDMSQAEYEAERKKSIRY